MNREINNVDNYTNYSSNIPIPNVLSGNKEECKHNSNCHQGLFCLNNKCGEWQPSIETFENKRVKESLTLKYTSRKQNSGKNFY